MAPHTNTNGTNGVDGPHRSFSVAHTNSWSSKVLEKDSSYSASSEASAPLASAVPHSPLKADRAGITDVFNQFAQVVHVPRRPLQTQSSNGTASAKRTQTGMKMDMKYIGWKGEERRLLVALI